MAWIQVARVLYALGVNLNHLNRHPGLQRSLRAIHDQLLKKEQEQLHGKNIDDGPRGTSRDGDGDGPSFFNHFVDVFKEQLRGNSKK